MSDVKMKVYLAGPINDCTDEECKGWRERMIGELPNIEFLDPMRRDYRAPGADQEFFTEIVEADKQDILESDVVFVYHDKPSVGTSMEVLFAYEQGIYTIVVHATGKPLSPWIIYHTTEIVNNIEEGIEQLKLLADDFSKYEVGNWEDDV